MSENRERAFRIALHAVLAAAVAQGLDIDLLTEAAIGTMLSEIAYTSDDVTQAVLALEVAADAVV